MRNYMKNLLFIAFLFSINLIAQSQLEKAILETNLQVIEQILKKHSLPANAKSQFLDLAQEIIEEINRGILIDELRPRPHSLSGALGLLGLIPLFYLIVFYGNDYRYERDGIWPPIAVLSILLCGITGRNNQHEYVVSITQKRIDAIKIKQRIFNA